MGVGEGVRVTEGVPVTPIVIDLVSEPVLLLQDRVYVVVVCGVMLCDPLVFTVPLQPLLLVHTGVVPVIVQLMVEFPPRITLCGLRLSWILGGIIVGVGLGIFSESLTIIVIDLELLPALFVHVKV